VSPERLDRSIYILIGVYLVGILAAMIAPAAVPWPALVQQFPNHRGVLFFELTCRCGDWRSAIPIDSESLRLACPRCGELHRPFVLGRGLVQSDVPWVLVSPSLTKNRSARIHGPRTGRPKKREVTARVLRTVNLMVQGRSTTEIAKELGLTVSHYCLFAKRRQADIRQELTRITINSHALETPTAPISDAAMV
jgi:hypothetical protein